MRAEERRRGILEFLEKAVCPVTAGVLSEKFNVSRQVIVQDIALLRAGGCDVTSTNRGYILNVSVRVSRVFKCRHTLKELPEECALIIEGGGAVNDVFVNHRIYGRISSRLDLKTRTDIEELYRSLASGASKPLMSITDGYHYHTVTAASEDKLDKIEELLRIRGFLVET